MQIDYDKKNIKFMLFTELVIASTISNDDTFEKEIKRRLTFCGFESKMINFIVNYELELLKSSKKL